MIHSGMPSWDPHNSSTGRNSLDRGLGVKSAASHSGGLLSEVVKGAISLTREQTLCFPPHFWASGDQPAPKPLSHHDGKHPGGKVGKGYFFFSSQAWA